jgi:hypothetical protein
MKPLVALLLAFCLTVHAGPAEQAQQSAAADVVTTGVGLALGAAEANPLGLALIPLKLIALDYAAGLPDGEKQTAQHALSALWTGAASNNLCIIAILVTGGMMAPVCVAIGVVTAAHSWQSGSLERDFWMVCASERQTNPKLQCNFKQSWASSNPR